MNLPRAINDNESAVVRGLRGSVVLISRASGFVMSPSITAAAREILDALRIRLNMRTGRRLVNEIETYLSDLCEFFDYFNHHPPPEWVVPMMRSLGLYLIEVRDGIRIIAGQNFWQRFRRRVLIEEDLAEYARGLRQETNRFHMRSSLNLVRDAAIPPTVAPAPLQSVRAVPDRSPALARSTSPRRAQTQ